MKNKVQLQKMLEKISKMGEEYGLRTNTNKCLLIYVDKNIIYSSLILLKMRVVKVFKWNYFFFNETDLF